MVSAAPPGVYAPPAPPPRHQAPPAPPAGCAGCRSAEYTGWRSGGELLLRCGACDRVLVRAPSGAVAEFSPDDRTHGANTWPQPGRWAWAGYVQETAGGRWVKLAEAPTLGEVWDVLDTAWPHGRRLAVPVRADGSEEAAAPAPRVPAPPPGLFFPVPQPPARTPTPRQDEKCGRCARPVRVCWRTLSNGARVLWSRCTRCGRGGRAMPRTPANEAEAAANPPYQEATP